MERPSDPFDYHLYIGFAHDDLECVRTLHQMIETDLRITCFLRYGADDSQMGVVTSLSDRILDGIEFSEKCLLCVTPAYVEDHDRCSGEEISAVVQKTKIFQDAVLVLRVGLGVETTPGELRSLPTVEIPTFEHLLHLPLSEDFSRALKRSPSLTAFQRVPEQVSGSAEAFVYFNSYLRYILNDYSARYTKELNKVTNSAAPSSDIATQQMQCVDKLLVVLPESCRAPMTMEDGDRLAGVGFVGCSFNRCGEKNRDCKVTMFRLVDGDRQYFFAGEFPACLHTLYETQNDGLTGMTGEKLYKEGENFCETLKYLVSSYDLADECILAKWRDLGEEPLHDCIINAVRNEARCMRDECSVKRRMHSSNGFSRSKSINDDSFHSCSKMSQVILSHKDIIEVDQLPVYPLIRTQRGLCAIIDVRDSTGCEHWLPANTTSVADRLYSLFAERLQFVVRTFAGPATAEQLRQTVAELHDADYQMFDAFACCLISRGRRGFVRTVGDGQEVAVLDLAVQFYDHKCPSLREKPKLFIVLTCRSGNTLTTPCPMSLDRTQHSLLSGVSASLSHVPISERDRTNEGYPMGDGRFQSDAVNPNVTVSPTAEDGELLIPFNSDFFVSYCTLTDDTASLYVDALESSVVANPQFEHALNGANEQIRQKLSELEVVLPKSESVPFCSHSSGSKALVF
jgi:hypothetical protein